MTKQPQPKKDWVAIIKQNIEADDEFRQVSAFRKGVDAGVTYFEGFFDNLEEKARRDEYIDPKAFEKAVRAYPNLIAGPLVAKIMMETTFNRAALRTLAEKQTAAAIRKIEIAHARNMDIMESRIYNEFQKIIDAQQERLNRLSAIEEEQDVNFMRAITLWEEQENLKYVPTWSPVQQLRNIRNLYRRHTLQREAMKAFGACQPTKGKSLADQIKTEHEKTAQELVELKASFKHAKERIEQLGVQELNLFDSRLQREVRNRTHRSLMSRFDILYPSSLKKPR